MTILANSWVGDGHSVSLITTSGMESDFWPIDSGITRFALDLTVETKTNIFSGVIKNIQRVIAIRRVILNIRPDVVLSFLDSTNLLSAIAMIGLDVSLVVSERTDPTQLSIGTVRETLRPFIYRKYSKCLVVQTDNVRYKCKERWPGLVTSVIANPLASELISYAPREREKVILSVGRLDSGKGFDTLISAFSIFALTLPDWSLRICGEGPERPKLQALINGLGLQSKVLLAGTSRQIFQEYANAEVFCLASRYEGFPNSLLEALAMGCACIATDCDSGPREMLEDGRLGLLTSVDDVEALAKALRRVIEDADLRKQMQGHGAYVRNRYAIERISRQWLDLFTAVTA